MNTKKPPIEGLLIVEPDIFKDGRGLFLETFQREKYKALGIDREFVQDNLSCSIKGVLRGLHFQKRNPQAKLVQVVHGEVYDVTVDLRRDSPTFGEWFGIRLSAENMRQLYIPEGFAHGFCVLSETALFSYKCSALYDPLDEGGLLWSDPEVGVQWPLDGPILSEKDSRLPTLSQLTGTI